MNYTYDFRDYQTKYNQELKQTSFRHSLLDPDPFNQTKIHQNTVLDQLKLSKLKINFQQKYEDYIQENTLNITKPFITNTPNSRLQLEQKLKNLQPITARQRSSHNRSTDSDQEIYYKISEIQTKNNVIETDKYDYQNLYRQIKLKPLAQEANQSETLQKQDKLKKRNLPSRNQRLNHHQLHFISQNNSRIKHNKNIGHSSSFRINQQKIQISKFYDHRNSLKYNQIFNINQRQQQSNLDLNYRYNIPSIQNKTLSKVVLDKALQTSFFVESKVKMIDEQLQTKLPQIQIASSQIINNNKLQKQQNKSLTNQNYEQQAPTKPINYAQLIKKGQKNISPTPSHQLEMETFHEQPQKPKVFQQQFSQSKSKNENQSQDETLSRVNMLQVNSGEYKKIVKNYPLEVGQMNNFDLKVYMKIYYCLKIIQKNIRNPNLLKGIKNYLELIASGKIDNYEYIRTPLHKKKLLKMSLLYQRISIIIISFAYASNTINQCSKYLINLMKVIVNNYLIILKILSSEYNNKQMQNDVEYKQIWILSNKEFENKGFQTLKQNNQIIIQFIYKLSKYDRVFYQNLRKFIKNANKFTIQQNFYYILQYFSFFLNICQLEHKIPFLSVAPNPYLPPIHPQKYTIVIDILQIMCHPKKNDLIRPYSEYFLDQVSRYYQIVVFSIAFPNQVNKIVQHLDKKKCIKYRLYKHHSIKSNGIYLKDLTRLGRNMQKTILLDSQSQQNQINKQNCLYIKTWEGNNKDTVLAEVCPLLASIVLKNMDVRQGIQSGKNIMLNNLRGKRF